MSYHVITSLLLFVTGMFGLFSSRKNLILVIMSIEIMTLSVSLNLLFMATYLDDFTGYTFILFILCINAGETAIGLALVLLYLFVAAY